MVRDEADIIEESLRHLAANVDEVLVWDNGSTDGTADILEELLPELGGVLTNDPEVAYWQSRKMTAAAQLARARGHEWVVPCDADELWYAPEADTVGEHLTRVGRDVQIVRATLYDYMPPPDLDGWHPFVAITYRRREPGVYPKVACRTHPDLVIDAGNHGARYGVRRAMKVDGLVIRHFTWRTREQYLRKIRNGLEAYGATDLPEHTGAHWRMWEGASDEEIMEHFDTWFTAVDPEADPALVRDPAVVLG